MMRIAVPALLLGLVLGGAALNAAEPSALPLSPQAVQAAAKIRSTLKSSGPAGPAEQMAQWKVVAEEVLPLTKENLLVQETLKAGLEAATAETDAARASSRLRQALREAAEILEFQPQIEAPLPVGFPPLTPVGEIQIVKYPAYRLAKTPMKVGQNGAFWTLFRHIQKHEIAMTAPVEITYESNPEAPPCETEMAFLYRSTQQGAIGPDGKVEVVDLPAITVLSFGLRGNLNRARLADAEARLKKWLEQHADQYRAVGPLRVMGHNSPFVFGNRRYIEVQIPVGPPAASPADAD